MDDFLAAQHREDMRRIYSDHQKEREEAIARFRASFDRNEARYAWIEAHPPPVSRPSRYRIKKRRRWKQNASSQYVGRLLAARVSEWKLSDRNAAKRCGVSQSFFTRIINGQRNVSHATATRMADCLAIRAPLDRLPDGSTPVWALANCPPRRARQAVQSP